MLLQLTITTDVDDAEREEPAAASGDDAVQKDTASADTASSENQQVTAETTATRLVNNDGRRDAASLQPITIDSHSNIFIVISTKFCT